MVHLYKIVYLLPHIRLSLIGMSNTYNVPMVLTKLVETIAKRKITFFTSYKYHNNNNNNNILYIIKNIMFSDSSYTKSNTFRARTTSSPISCRYLRLAIPETTKLLDLRQWGSRPSERFAAQIYYYFLFIIFFLLSLYYTAFVYYMLSY